MAGNILAFELLAARSLHFPQPVVPEMGCNMGEREEWRCLFMQEITKKIRNPLYVVQSGYDCEHLKVRLMIDDCSLLLI